MMYHRGHAADYDDWVAAGAEGWSWDENKKYFDMTEGNKQIGSLVKSEYHSSTGPLPIQQVSTIEEVKLNAKTFGKRAKKLRVKEV